MERGLEKIDAELSAALGAGAPTQSLVKERADHMMPGVFDPRERALAKQRARDKDDHAIAAGEVTRSEVARRNSFFGALDLSKWRIVQRRRRKP